jgi:hypothetical protein
MTNCRTRIHSAFASLVIIGLTCTGCTNLGINWLSKSKVETPPSAHKPREAADTIGDALAISPRKLFDIGLVLISLSGIAIGIAGYGKAKDALMESEDNERDLASYKDHVLRSYLNSKSERLSKIENELQRLSKDLRQAGELLEKANTKTFIDRSEYSIERSRLLADSTENPQVSLNQKAQLERSNSDQVRAPGPSFNVSGQSQLHTSSSQFGSKPIKTTAQQQEELTAAVNGNERQAVKNATRTQLNITSDSDNAIATGRLTQTELEEVSGGGSYLLMVIDTQGLLYPTEQTLNGFGQLQPAKGVFAYLKQSIATPQVLTPALVERVGSNWRVQQLGTIAVPV